MLRGRAQYETPHPVSLQRMYQMLLADVSPHELNSSHNPSINRASDGKER